MTTPPARSPGLLPAAIFVSHGSPTLLLGDATLDGMDHGVWVPLSLIWPQADVPVVVVSLDARLDPAMHLAIGRALRGLDAEGDTAALVRWEVAPPARRAHPSAEHFVPLLVAAGVGGARETLHESDTFGVLGMHAYGFGAAG